MLHLNIELRCRACFVAPAIFNWNAPTKGSHVVSTTSLPKDNDWYHSMTYTNRLQSLLTNWHADLSASLQQATVQTMVKPHQICDLRTATIRNGPARVSTFHQVSNGILWTDKGRWPSSRSKEAEQSQEDHRNQQEKRQYIPPSHLISFAHLLLLNYY